MEINSETTRQHPQSLSDLFVTFTVMALQGFGGVLTVAQRELVEKKRWMTNAEFVEEWAVAQIMPGPNIINLCIMLGGRYFGLRGVLASIAGMLFAPLLLLLLLALIYAQFASHPGVVGALRGMGAVAAGMIVASGIKMIPSQLKNPMGGIACLLLGMSSFVAVALMHWPLVYLLLVLGPVAYFLTYRKLSE
jgi:chromate transporter